MARKNYQIAHDLVRYVNNINDQLDCLAYKSRRIDPNTGGTYLIDGVAPSYAQLYEQVNLNLNAAKNFLSVVVSLQSSTAYTDVTPTLNAFNVTKPALESDISDFSTVISTIEPMILAATLEADLITIADYLDANVERLTLVRRPWNLP